MTWSRRQLLGRGAAAGGLLVAPGILVTCRPGNGEQSTLERIKEQGTVRVGFADEAPYAYQNEQGELVGAGPAVHREIFTALGVPGLEPHVTDFGSLIPGLQADRWDVATAGMYILPSRCEQAAFAEPEYCGDSAFLVKRGNPKGITNYRDVAEKDATIGVLPAAVEADYAENAGVERSQIQIYERPPDGLEGVVAGRIDALALTSPSLRYVIESNPDAPVEMTEPFIPTIDGEEQHDCGGAAFRRNDQDLVKAFNAELAKLEESGRLLELIRPYGFTKMNIPSDDVTTEQLCEH